MYNKKRFELRTAEYRCYNIFGQEFVVKNYRRDVETVADVFDFIFEEEWHTEPRLDPETWFLMCSGQVVWDVKTFLGRVKLMAIDDGVEIKDIKKMSLFDFVDHRVKITEQKGGLIVNRVTREFTGPDTPSNEDVVLQYHGLAAYSGSTGFSEKLATCLSEAVVICGSDKAIGPVGVVFEGPVFKAHDTDIWSTRESREVVRRIPSVTEEDFFEMSEMMIGKGDYIETFTQMREVFGIWCDPAAHESIKEEVVNLAREYNLEIFWGIPKRLGKPEAEKEFFAGLVKVGEE